MIIKESIFCPEDDFGTRVFPLFNCEERLLEKTAGAGIMPGVINYIDGLRPQEDCQYVLVNALGAGEYYGSNSNGDFFPEAALIHVPPNWRDNPLLDKHSSLKWHYGYPTFYSSNPFVHHRNKDPNRAIGTVEYVTWNPHMHRVELVAKLEYSKCLQFGGRSVWDQIKAGRYPNVSMGAKVPFDCCSITLDRSTFQKARDTFDPKIHSYEGIAIKNYHESKKRRDGIGIRGLAITQKEYSEYCKSQLNKILPDGRKVFLYNDFPKFFDISFVFIGADRTATTMIFISDGKEVNKQPIESVSKQVSIEPSGLDKVASVKSAEITKEVVNNLGQALPIVNSHEKDIPSDLLDTLVKEPLHRVLATTTGLGMILKPKEFQKIIMVKMHGPQKAEMYDKANVIFPKVQEADTINYGLDDFNDPLADLLLPLFTSRTVFSPDIKIRIMCSEYREPINKGFLVQPNDIALKSISRLYNGYRHTLVDKLNGILEVLSDYKPLEKLASSTPSELFSPESVYYLRNSYWQDLSD